MKIVAEPIQVIAVFMPDKHPIPYKFKIKERNEESYVTFVIDRIIHWHKSRIAGIDAIIYTCQSLMNGVERRYEIKYILATCQWELYKI